MKKINLIYVYGCLVASFLSAAELITNGDFETGDRTDWTIRPFSQDNPSVISTTNTGWGNYALDLTRNSNTTSNRPGLSQSFTLSGADTIDISFDYAMDTGERLIFRILAIDDLGDYYVYGDDGGSTWTNVAVSNNTNWFQSSVNENVFANTAQLTAASTIVSSFSVSLPSFATAETSYRIDFFNPDAGTSIQFDNVSVSAIPEPSQVGISFGMIVLMAVTIKRRVSK